jgi:hypothetical protein
MPSDLRKRWEAELAAFDPKSIEANFAKTDAAAAEHSFSGFVRRSVHRGGKPLSLIAEETGIALRHLSQFMRGEGELNAAEIGRLLESVGVELVETMPGGG